MTPRRLTTESRDPTATDVDVLPRLRTEQPAPAPSRRRERLAKGSRAPTQVNLRRRLRGDGLDAVVAGLLGRAASARVRPSEPPQRPVPVDAIEPVAPVVPVAPAVPIAPRPRRSLWFAVAFIAAAALAAGALAIAFG